MTFEKFNARLLSDITDDFNNFLKLCFKELKELEIDPIRFEKYKVEPENWIVFIHCNQGTLSIEYKNRPINKAEDFTEWEDSGKYLVSFKYQDGGILTEKDNVNLDYIHDKLKVNNHHYDELKTWPNYYEITTDVIDTVTQHNPLP